jgi:PDZ domain
MRKLISVIVFTIGLVLGCYGFGGDAPAKAPHKNLQPKEIEALVKNLASDKEAARESAAKQLRETPGALTYLRAALADKNAQGANRRQLEELVDQIRAAHFKRRLAEMAKRKADAPLDLLAELLLENRQSVTPAEWKMAKELMLEISDHLCQDKKNKLKFSEENPPFPVTVGKEVTISEIDWNRVIADNLFFDPKRPGRIFARNILVLSNPLSDRRKRGSFGEIILIRAQPNEKHRQEFGRANSSFIFCDGDLNCDSALHGVLIATGKITYSESGNEPTNIVIPDAHQSKKIRLFSCADFGLELAEKDSKLEAVAISAGSIAEKSGLKRGDIIEEAGGKSLSLADFRRQMRQAYAQEIEIPLAIRRDGKKVGVSVSFVD